MTPAEIIPLLEHAGVDYVLVGAHGISVWREEPRATQDVDLLIPSGHREKAGAALLRAHPDWERAKYWEVWRFLHLGKVVVDVVLARTPFQKAILKDALRVEVQGQAIKVLSVESALAMKFNAMLALNREYAKKYLDASDFLSVLRGRKNVDLDKLRKLGDLLGEDGGGELLKMVRDARAGRKLEI